MKKTIVLLFSLVCISQLRAQTDTIFTHEGVIPCEIQEITESAAKYRYPGEMHGNTLSLNAIRRIVYRSGRVEEFASRTRFHRLASPTEWEQVSIANVEAEVQGLYKLGEVSSKAKGTTEFSNQERVKRRALDKIRMQAAILGANVVYMAQMRSEGNKFSWLGTATSAETSLFGTAYSSQLPRLEQVETLVGGRGTLPVTEEVTMTNSDSRSTTSGVKKTLTVERLYDDSGLVMIEGSLSGRKERTFRVAFCNDTDFFVVCKTRRGVFSYRVSAR